MKWGSVFSHFPFPRHVTHMPRPWWQVDTRCMVQSVQEKGGCVEEEKGRNNNTSKARQREVPLEGGLLQG